MEQKYYIAENGNSYLTITNHPGTLKESDILNNLARMMQEDEEISPKEARIRANEFYQENIERILEMVELGAKLQEVSQDEAEETMNLTFSEWIEWEFPRTEWD
ncbi:hypothetical protein [Prevotella sp.]|uniref:hypothetical protein n=1 Tax=Prevotella sp. TaxID=59823 RepID=UPI003AB395D1